MADGVGSAVSGFLAIQTSESMNRKQPFVNLKQIGGCRLSRNDLLLL